MTRLSALLLVVLVSGCGGVKTGDEPSTERIVIAPLVTLSAVSAEEDPLAAHRPSSVACNSLTGWYVENGLLEANTAECSYLALSEPAAAPAYRGEMLTTSLSHFDLTAPEAAEAHLALLVEADVIWEQTIPIPTAAQVLSIAVELGRDIRKGDRIGIHLHNHGQNTWNLSPLTVERSL